MDELQKSILAQITDIEKIPSGAFNIRINGKCDSRQSSANIEIEPQKDREGINIYIKENTKNESVHIPVVLTKLDMHDSVYNDFYVGENADITIVAGCGISCGKHEASHSGIHTFHIGKNAKVRYIEKHLGTGGNEAKRVMMPETNVLMEEGGQLIIEATQIKGISETIRTTNAELGDNSVLIVKEKMLTSENDDAKSVFKVNLNGENSRTEISSRSVAKDTSKIEFISKVNGNSKCFAHVECDALLKDKAIVKSTPEVCANCTDANLIHEAAIGKIAGEQLLKLTTLGLSLEEAEEAIIKGFLN